jgi:hypothetical protein
VQSPGEDRLYALCWKDDCYFYGDKNSYVTRPSAFRDRTLLKLLESACTRDHAPSDNNPVEEQQEQDLYESVRPSDHTELEALLPNKSPSCIQSFVSNLLQSQVRPDGSVVEQHLLGRKRMARIQDQLDLLNSHLFAPECYRAQLFARGLSRRIDALLPPDDFADPALFLDYLPVLRVMATMDFNDRAASALYQKPDDSTKTKYRRSTRNSQRSDNRHFLVELVPHSQFNDDLGPDSVSMIVERLFCRSLLKLG